MAAPIAPGSMPTDRERRKEREGLSITFTLTRRDKVTGDFYERDLIFLNGQLVRVSEERKQV